MQKVPLHTNTRGFSLVEILVALSVFALFAVALTSTLSSTSRQARHAANTERAAVLAEEALEASRNVRDADFANLTDGTFGLATTSSQWSFNGSSDTKGIFTRAVTVSTISENQKKVDTTISWADQVSGSNSLTMSTYLTNWHAVLNLGTGLTVNKTVINHGGSKVAADFAPFKVGTTTIQIASSTIFALGTYTVSETTDPNYTQTFSGDCNGSGSITLTATSSSSCVITNEEKASRLTVTKVVINHGGTKVASDFTLLVDSNPVVSGVTNTFNSGVHTVSEVPDAAYAATFSGDCDSGGLVTLVPNTTKTCTVTNEETTALPTVTTPTVTNIAPTTATLGANVTSLGIPASISVRGTCWGTSPAPATNCVAEGGTTTGVFTQARTGLTPGTVYYYRGYATNSTGTGYSPDGTFTTLGGACAVTGITPTTYDNSGSTSAVVTKPTGVVQNDIMFAYILHNNATDRLTTIPSGWTQIVRHKNASSNQALYYKVAGASEPASYTFGLSASSRFAVTINAYRGCFNTTTPIQVSSNTEYITNNTTYRASSMTLLSPYTTVIMFPSVNASGVKTFAAPVTQGGGWTQDYANGNASSQFSRNAYSKLITVSGVTGVIDSIGFSATTGKHAFAVALKPL